MRRASRFTIPPNWKVFFNDLGIEIHQVLAHAGLPSGLFDNDKVQLTTEQYFQFWLGIESAYGDQMPLKFADAFSLESCDVPIYAAVCSPNLNAALERLREYKPLIGPMILDIDANQSTTHLTLGCYGYNGKLPKILSLVEIVFFTQLARIATRQRIEPLRVTLPEPPNNLKGYEEYLGCKITQGDLATIEFRTSDANAPFLTDNQAMLALFDKELNQKLEALQQDDSVTNRVSRILASSLPQGESNIEGVAAQMAVSKRTLQRKLAAEEQSFQTVLQQVRYNLAEHYLKQTQLPILEVSFLLGFQESNSFIRAYSSWTGSSPTQARNACHH
ncbi:AraC family transcriptional regulator [Vibrio paucivorans]|uniref:AraC family transcriptional regulator n=1 Tax=Vibrio paucivorans TaxID=2829489 RepID=A0A9X3CFZ1_9VIBR|nr:AraC family transcriptional regulator [Vibrio paucivorans]MCW8335032.1 AraC family transcriptional regulator [Vibrio paucivorans]